MNKLIESVKKNTKKSSIELGSRKRINTDTLIQKYPDGVTLTGCALFHNKEDDTYYGVITFKESDTEYYSGGTQLTATIKKWFATYGEEETQQMLKDTENPVVIKIEKGKFKGRDVNNIVYVC